MCHSHRATQICYFNYLNFCCLDKHRLGCLVPLREVRFTLNEKQASHGIEFLLARPSECQSSFSAMSSQVTLPLVTSDSSMLRWVPSSTFSKLLRGRSCKILTQLFTSSAFSWHRRWFALMSVNESVTQLYAAQDGKIRMFICVPPQDMDTYEVLARIIWCEASGCFKLRGSMRQRGLQHALCSIACLHVCFHHSHSSRWMRNHLKDFREHLYSVVAKVLPGGKRILPS